MTKLFPNQPAKAGKEFLSLDQKTKLRNFLLFLLILFIPSQFGRHFWFSFSYINGIRIDYLSPTLYFTDILIFSFLSLSIKRREVKNLFIKLKNSWEGFALFCLIGLILSGVLFSANPYVGIYGLFKLTEFVLLVFAIAKNLRRIGDGIYFALGIGIICESILAILQFINKGSLGGFLYFLGERNFTSLTPNIANASINGSLILRPYGTFSHPNVLAGYLVVGMFIILINLERIRGWKQNVLLFVLTLGSLGLFLTLSRVAIALWVIILFVYVVRDKGVNHLKKAVSLLILATAVIIVNSVFHLLPRLTGMDFDDPSLIERVNLLKASFLMLWDNLFLGVGLNNFLVSLPHYYLNSGTVFNIQPVHNIFLLALVQIGLVSFFFVLALAVKLFKNTTTNYRLLLVIVGILGFFDHYFLTLQQGQLLLAICLSLSLANLRIKRA